MNDKIYQTCKFLAIGILIGYVGKYALNLARTKLTPSQESPQKAEERDEY
jgi:hypothetical protein